jgi:acetyl esterase/lipase
MPMSSWQMHAVAAYMRLMRRPRTYATASTAAAWMARPKQMPDPPERLNRRHRVSRSVIDDFAVYTVTAERSPTTRTGSIVYVHGGGYVNEIHRQHWKLVADIADATGRAVQVPIYGLAPQHHAEQAITFLQAVLIRASADGPIYLAGDSSGAGLALAATQTWIAAGGTPPAGLTLISPWLDIALTNPGIAAIEPRDPWLAVPGLRECGKAWAANVPLDDPRVSPICGQLTSLPPIDLYIGDRDIFLPDSRRLRDTLPPEGLNYHEQPGGIHVYPLLPTPEARATRPTLLAHITEALDGPNDDHH